MASEPTTVAASSRVKEFPGEYLSVRSGKLFCTACREPVSVKKSMINLHVKSSKHSSGVQRLQSKGARQKDIASMLKEYDEEVHPVGEGLSDDVRIFRVRVLSCFLKAGVV